MVDLVAILHHALVQISGLLDIVALGRVVFQLAVIVCSVKIAL